MMATVLLDASFGVMHAIIERIDECTSYGQLVLHPPMQSHDLILFIVPMTHAGLVGHNDNTIPEIIQTAHGLLRASYPVDLVGSMHIALVDVKNAIAIQKNRWPDAQIEQFLPTLLQCLAQTDVDEVALVDNSSESSFLREGRENVGLNRAGQRTNAMDDRLS